MLTFNSDQFSQLSELAEDAFVQRLLHHLERNCPVSALPSGDEARRAFSRDRIAAARARGLTWQKTIAEHARLATLRRAGQPVVDPDRLAGDDPRAADTVFAEHIRRAALVGRVERG